MTRVFHSIATVLFLLLVGGLAGCSSAPPSYENEDFVKSKSDTYSRAFAVSGETACDAGRRALLSQGYNIDRADTQQVAGHKNFQSEDGQHTQISFNINCAGDAGGSERSTVFVNAVQDRYSIKKTSSSASVGLSVLGAVSMPFGSSDDSLVKTASQTISRPKYYDGFFDLLRGFLPDAKAQSAAAKPAPAAPAKSNPTAPAAPASGKTLDPDATGVAAGPSAPASPGSLASDPVAPVAPPASATPPAPATSPVPATPADSSAPSAPTP